MNTTEMITYFEEALGKYVPAINNNDYKIKSSEVYNIDHPENVFNRFIYYSDTKSRRIYIDFRPRQTISFHVFFMKDDDMTCDRLVCDINAYLEYKKTKQPIFAAPAFQIDRDRFEESLEEQLSFIQSLLAGELKGVIQGKKIIKIPMIDFRDLY